MSARNPPANTQWATGPYTRIGEGAGDQRRGDDRERHLVRAEEDERDREEAEELVVDAADADVLEERELQVADHAGVARVAERQAEHDHGPEHPEQAHGEDVLHQHAEHVLRPDHAAVEQRQARRHEQHERRRHEHPGRVTTVQLELHLISSLRNGSDGERMTSECFPDIS
jgi:hypothetical protein